MVEAYELVKKYIPSLQLKVSGGRHSIHLNGLLLIESTSTDVIKSFCCGTMFGFVEGVKQDEFTVIK